jgi:hypothetical protein
MPDQEFSMAIRLTTPAAALSQPIVIEIKVTYEGDKKVEVLSLDGNFLDLAISTPKGWEPKAKKDTLGSFNGRIPVATLAHGQPMSRIVDLHDFFTKITPGKTELSFTLNVWPERGEAKKPVVLTRTFTLDIVGEPAK